MPASSNKSAPKGLTRRKFVAAMTAAAGTAALAGSIVGCAPTENSPANSVSAPAEEVYQGICRANCGGACHMNVHVREGKVVKTSVINAETPQLTRLCQRGLSHVQRIYAPERIKSPLRRVEGTPRGGGEWEQLTWDEAITYITDKWKGYREELGDSSVAFWKGTGSYANEQYYFSSRLRNVLGVTEIIGGHDQNGLVALSNMLTRGQYMYGNGTNDVLNAKNIFIWSCNATISEAVRWNYIQEAKEQGAKLVCIDPNFTGAASKSDVWVPIRPGTDAVLAMAMSNIVVAENLIDSDYLAKGTVAPFLVKADTGKYLRLSDMGIEPTEGPVDPRTGKPTVVDPIVVRGQDGTVDTPDKISDVVLEGSYTIEGKEVSTAYSLLLARIAEWTPERAAEVCDLPVETIYDIARQFADGPTTTYMQFGMDHWVNGHTGYHAVLGLMVLSGQISKLGAGFQGGVGGSSAGAGASLSAVTTVEGHKAGPVIYGNNLLDVMNEQKTGQTPLTIKSIYSYYSNPLCCMPDRNALIEAIDKVELFIVADSIMHDTARYADIVLPTPHWFEINTACVSVTPFARINEQAIAPLFESKSDFDIANLIADAMGKGDVMGWTEDEWFEGMFDNDGAKKLGLSWESLKEEKNIRVLPDDYIFAADYVYPTPTKRAEFYLESPKPLNDYGQEQFTSRWALPYWDAPAEAWHENPLIEKYPLNVMSYRDRFKTHTTFSLHPWLEELRSEPTLSLNSQDASARGINDGDYVRAFNDRGSVVLKAHIHEGMRPGVVASEHTWYQESYKEGHFQALSSRAINNFIASTAPFDALCQVEKV